MIPECGHLALIAAFFLSVALCVLPLVGTALHSATWMKSAVPLSIILFTFISISFACLAWSFWVDDFSVAYVVANSNLELPRYYKLSALWSAHEGSLLLWVWLLSAWTLAVALFSSSLPLTTRARVLATMGAVAIGFLAFLLFTSNPFARYLPFSPADGGDLNPLLQDVGLIVHPPTLYLGYVGFSVAFAFAIAALLGGRVDAAWVQWVRPWTLAAWIFLTLGIALGSWWAYYELGWGGWWFWDPVENASFMPWLTGTALLHSLAVTEKRGVFRSWTLLLAIFAFSLSLLGTFLVRSGVLTSVHAFASDPTRGYFILAFLVIVVGGSLTLYAMRAPLLKEGHNENGSGFAWLSRETALLFNNIFLVLIMMVVLVGTLYPLVADALHLGKISVGPPYFNFFFAPLATLLLLLLPVGTLLKWKQDIASSRKQLLSIAAIVSLFAGLLFATCYGDKFSWSAFFAVSVAIWAAGLTTYDIYYQSRHAKSFSSAAKKLSRSYKGMIIAHLGFVVSVCGVALTSIYAQSIDVRMSPGKTISHGHFDFVLDEIHTEEGPNYSAVIGQVSVYKNGNRITQLMPEKRSYHSDRGNKMTEAGIDAGIFADIYVAMGEPIDPQNTAGDWAMRLHYKPFVRWIWFGAIIMALGAGLSLSDRRYRKV